MESPSSRDLSDETAIRRRAPTSAVRVDQMTFQIPDPEAQPRNILEKIVWHKEQEVERLRQQVPLARLKEHLSTCPAPLPFVAALHGSEQAVSLIAEVKRASPSKGVLRQDFDPVAIARAYAEAGAACLSVLTDSEFFQGSGEYLRQIRAAVRIPLLCKEFILYPYQILWARTLGADAVLLIAAILNNADLSYCLRLTDQLGMAALVEVHTLAELDRALAQPGLRLLGINNRDLTTFRVSLETTRELLAARKDLIAARGITVVSESGIFTPADLRLLQGWGVRSVLVGEALVTQPDPGLAARTLLEAP